MQKSFQPFSQFCICCCGAGKKKKKAAKKAGGKKAEAAPPRAKKGAAEPILNAEGVELTATGEHAAIRTGERPQRTLTNCADVLHKSVTNVPLPATSASKVVGKGRTLAKSAPHRAHPPHRNLLDSQTSGTTFQRQLELKAQLAVRNATAEGGTGNAAGSQEGCPAAAGTFTSAAFPQQWAAAAASYKCLCMTCPRLCFRPTPCAQPPVHPRRGETLLGGARALWPQLEAGAA